MTGVVDDTPQPDTPPGEPASSRPPATGRAGGKARNELLSDHELQERHRDRPWVGRLVVDARRYLTAASPRNPFVALAKAMRADRPELYPNRSYRTLATTISGQVRDPAGFSRDTLEAVLRLFVPETEKAQTAKRWAQWWIRDGRDPVEFQYGPRTAPPPVDPPPAGEDPPTVDDPPPDQWPPGAVPTDQDQVIAEQRTQLLANARTITELVESRDRLRAVTASTRRYEILSPRPAATVEEIDGAVHMLYVALGVPGMFNPAQHRELLDPQEGLAVNAEAWRELGVSPNHWTANPFARQMVTLMAVIQSILALILAISVFYQWTGN